MPKDRKSKNAGIEYRERIAALSEELKETGADPFAVDVDHILEELRKDYAVSDPRILTADAKALGSVSEVVQMQDTWIGKQLSGLQVDPALLLDRVKRLGLRSLAASLYSSQHLPVGVKQVATKRLLEAAEYWIQLSGWGGRLSLPSNQMGELLTETLELTPEDLEQEVKDMSESVLQSVAEGPVAYDALLGQSTGAERLKRAFVLSLICARGAVTLRYDPLLGKYVVQRAEGTPDSSVAIKV
ncbi:MAG: hypothetical protein JRN68_04225 [Nitrososphaerota archaeon]|nr:hypothetical protein [Nitrososphaerota archaeon]